MRMPCALPFRLCIIYFEPVADSNHPEIEPLTRTQVLMVMGVTAVILLAVVKLWQQFGSASLLPVRVTTEAVLLGLGMALAITVASSVIYRLWPAYRRSANAYLELILKPLVWPDLFWLGLLPGLSEELLFRGMIIPALGGGITAVVVSSLVFGVLHISGSQKWSYVVWATIVGLMLGSIAVATGNLLVPIIAHVTTNFASSCIWKLQH